MTPWMAELHRMRTAWAARPDRAPPGMRPRSMPTWAGMRPTLRRARKHWNDLYASGEVVFAVVLIGDPSLFRPSPSYTSARVAWSADPRISAEPGGLDEVRLRFLHLRQHGSALPGLRSYATLAQDNDHHPDRQPMPTLVSGSALVFEQEVMVDPLQLPGSRIAHPAVPLVVHPTGEVTGAFILHRSMWSPRMLQGW